MIIAMTALTLILVLYPRPEAKALTEQEQIEMRAYGRILTPEERTQDESPITTDYQCVSIMYLNPATQIAYSTPAEGDLAIITIWDITNCDGTHPHMHIIDINTIPNIHEVHDMTSFATEDHLMP